MKIIIAGAGAVGTHLAKLLSGEKQDIILMDTDEERLHQLEDNFDLMLTGSTYGGMAPFLSGWVKNSNGGFLSGLYSITNRMQLYVSSGTNCWAPAPIRLGNSGEITLITVHSREISDEMRSQRIYNFN